MALWELMVVAGDFFIILIVLVTNQLVKHHAISRDEEEARESKVARQLGCYK